jgi:hypothetical protein
VPNNLRRENFITKLPSHPRMGWALRLAAPAIDKNFIMPNHGAMRL